MLDVYRTVALMPNESATRYSPKSVPSRRRVVNGAVVCTLRVAKTVGYRMAATPPSATSKKRPPKKYERLSVAAIARVEVAEVAVEEVAGVTQRRPTRA